MPDVISTTEKTELAPHVREGYLMLYIYLPGTFREEFTEYIGPILSSIIQVSPLPPLPYTTLDSHDTHKENYVL